MAKTTPKDKKELILPDESTEIATPMAAKRFLSTQATQLYEPGFTKIKMTKEGAFVSTGFGAGEEFVGMILAVEPTRALWGFGTEEEEKAIEEWKGIPPLCSARNMDCVRGIGSLPKIIDDDAPDIVRQFIQPVIDIDFRCDAGNDTGCPWSAYGSKGKGMACQEQRQLLIYGVEDGTYGSLSLPPTSLKPWREYLTGLPERDFSAVLTKFSLEVRTNGPKIKWSVVRLGVAGVVPEEVYGSLSKTVFYKGQEIMEAQAVVSAFLGLDLVIDMDYETVDMEKKTPDTQGDNQADAF